MSIDPFYGTLTILFAGVFATDIWRFLGVAVASRLDEDSPWLAWVRAVATALIAGLVSRLLFFPPGTLEGTPLWLRLAGAVAAGGYFFFVRRQLWWALLIGEAIFLAGWLLAVEL